jgi:tetratricopeptide (TPR) repeat protein
MLLPGWTEAADDPVTQAVGAADQGRYADAIDTLRGALDDSPGDARILLALARVSERQARETLASTSPTVGQLGLVDALAWYEKASRAAPDSAEALLGEGRVAAALGKYQTAESALSRAAKLDPKSGEARYQLGYAYSLHGKCEQAIRAFDAAEELLGEDARIRLNRGMCEMKVGDSSAAERDFLRLVRAEADAGRRSSPAMRNALVWLWRTHSDSGDFGKAAAVFSRLAADYPDLQAAPWYVGHAKLAGGDAAGAAEAFHRVTVLNPSWAEGWRQYGGALVRAGSFDAAVAALERELVLDPVGDAPQGLLLDIVNGMRAAKRIPDAIDLLGRMESSFPDDPVILERRGDLRFESGDAKGALADYEAATKLAPSLHEAEVKQEKAATILLRAGTAPEKYLRERLAAEPKPPGPGGVIFDFEGSHVYPRANGDVTWRSDDGAFHLARSGAGGKPANLTLTFIPTLDFRPFTGIRFRVRGEKGRFLVLRAKDCRDPLGTVADTPRLVYRHPIELADDWQTVTVPAQEFVPDDDSRPWPAVASRMRALVFEIGATSVPDLVLAKQVALDDIELVRPDGSTFPLARFDSAPREMTFLTSGATMPATPPPPSANAVSPDPSTFVNPVIFGDRFDPSTVHSGTGSYRIRLVENGLAEVALSILPGRDYTRAAAITFWARGAKGGERLRVGLEDSLDEDIGNAWPASSPRGIARYRLLEGWYQLTPRWRKYRIPCSESPDIDFRQLVRIRFIMGSDLGNPVGTTMYVDDIGWE